MNVTAGIDDAGVASEGIEDPPGNVPTSKNDRRQSDVFLAAIRVTRMPMVLSDPNQPDNPIVFCNPAFLEQTGYEEGEVLGRNCRFLQGPETDAETVGRIRAAIGGRQAITVELFNYRRNGQGFWNALYICPIYDADGSLLHFFASQLDVTNLKESTLRQRQYLDAVGTMASGVAHTVNNLMTVVLASITRASRAAVNDAQLVQLGRAEQAARTAGRLTQQMLTFAQVQHLEARPTDLNVLVLALDDLLLQMVGNEIQIEFSLAEQPACAVVDARQVELSLLAIVQNAADATAPGERIVVTTRRYTSFEAFDGHAGRLWVELSVADRGVGMALDVARRATEPFFTTKPNGTGMGLAMVQGFVEQSKGRIAVETSPGRGTTVRLAFPECLPAGQ